MNNPHKIILISDLWGGKEPSWTKAYQERLSANFTLQYLDACVLGNIDTSHYTQEHLHQQFVTFGIDAAADRLVEMFDESHTFIGCSVGGVILWRAALKGLPFQKLMTISATRLRHETQPLDGDTFHYYGNEDSYTPTKHWLQTTGGNKYELLDGGHNIYKEKEVASLCISNIERS